MHAAQHILIAGFLAIFLAAAPPAAAGQEAATSEDERALIKARIRSELAQAAYYEEQQKKKAGFADNPTALAAVLGAVFTATAGILAASITALIGILTLRNNSRKQEEDKFHNALKQFGEVESPAARISASSILGDMGVVRRRSFKARHPWVSLRTPHFPFCETALNQLFGGLMLETNRAALLEIRVAIYQIIKDNPDVTLNMLANTNFRLQVEVRRSLSDYLIANGATGVDAVGDELWKIVPQYVFKLPAFKRLVEGNRKRFAEIFRGALLKYEAIPYAARAKHRYEVFDNLQLTTYRLYLNTDIYCYALPTSRDLRGRTRRHPLFLVDGVLEGADLSSTNLSYALLGGARLAGANLEGADIRGAWLGGADLKGVKLWGTLFNNETDFRGSNWWAADFTVDGLSGGDQHLLRYIYDDEECRQAIPPDRAGVHPTVIEFLGATEGAAGAPPAV